MTINKKDITKELVEKALQCKTAEDLMELAKAEGVSITKEDAEAYMAELADVEMDGKDLNVEMDGKDLKHVAGGDCYHYCPPDCHHCPYDV